MEWTTAQEMDDRLTGLVWRLRQDVEALDGLRGAIYDELERLEGENKRLREEQDRLREEAAEADMAREAAEESERTERELRERATAALRTIVRQTSTADMIDTAFAALGEAGAGRPPRRNTE